MTGPAQLPEGDFSFDLSAGGELAPTMAAACAFVKYRVELTGIAHLRGHETDRLAALAAEINRLGGAAHDTADSLVIEAPIPATAETGRFWRAPTMITAWQPSRRLLVCAAPMWWCRT